MIYVSIPNLNSLRTTDMPGGGARFPGAGFRRPGDIQKGSDPNLGGPYPSPPGRQWQVRGAGEMLALRSGAPGRPRDIPPHNSTPQPPGPTHPLKGRPRSIVLHLHCNFFTGFLNKCQGCKNLPLMLNCLIIGLLHRLEERDLDHF